MSTLEGAAPTSEEMGSGVGTGTVIGGLGGLLVGLTELAIPGIGWLAAAGTVAIRSSAPAWAPPLAGYSPQLKS